MCQLKSDETDIGLSLQQLVLKQNDYIFFYFYKKVLKLKSTQANIIRPFFMFNSRNRIYKYLVLGLE